MRTLFPSCALSLLALGLAAPELPWPTFVVRAENGAEIALRTALVTRAAGAPLTPAEALETVEETAAGAEQSWRFERAPRGQGDLEVRLHVDGADRGTRDARGLRLTSRDGAGGAVRYGMGTWVDANGTRTPVEPRFEAGEIVMTVPAAVIERSAYPAVLDPVVSAERAVDAPITYHRKATSLALAFGAQEYLALWGDQGGVWAKRISTSGDVLDDASIILPGDRLDDYPQASLVSSSSVVFDGANFVVGYLAGGSIQVATITPAGVLDQQAFGLSGATKWVSLANGGGQTVFAFGHDGGTQVQSIGSPSTMPLQLDLTASAITFDGTDFVLVGVLPASPGRLQAVRISPALAVRDATPIDIATVDTMEGQPVLTASGDQVLVTWNDASGLRASRLSAGAVLDPTPIQIAASATAHAVTQDDGSYLLAWSAVDAQQHSARKIRHLKSDGTFVEAGPLALDHVDSDALAIASDGADLLLGEFASPHEFTASRFTRAGHALGTTPMLNELLTTEQQPGVAASKTGFVALWLDGRDSIEAPSMYGIRLDAVGAPLDKEAFLLDAAVTTSSIFIRTPSAASNGADYLVAWDREADVLRGTFVHANGKLDAQLDLGSACAAPAAVFDGTQFVVVSSGTNAKLCVSRVSSAGRLLDPTPKMVDATFGDAVASRATFDGREILVTNGGLYRIDANGDVAGGIALGLVGDAPIASDGAGTSLIVAHAGNPSTSGGQVHAIRIDPSGTLGAPIPLTTDNAFTGALGVVWDGENFVATWNGSHTSDVWKTSVEGVRINRAGQVLDATPIPIAAADQQVTVAVGPAATGALVMLDAVPKGAGRSRRVTTRLVCESNCPSTGDGGAGGGGEAGAGGSTSSDGGAGGDPHGATTGVGGGDGDGSSDPSGGCGCELAPHAAGFEGLGLATLALVFARRRRRAA